MTHLWIHGIYVCVCICIIPKSTTFDHTKNLGVWSMNPFYRCVSDRMFPTYVFFKPFTVKFPDKCEWQNRFNSDNRECIGWYVDGSKTNKGNGAGGD